MKNLLLTVLLIAFSTSISNAYDFSNKQLAPINYNLTLSSEVKNLISQINPDFFQDEQAEIKFRFQIYFAVENILKSNGINILPYQCFEPKSSTDKYGFPKITASRAVKTGVSNFYFKIDIALALEKPIENEKGNLLVKMEIIPYKTPSIIPMERIDTETSHEITIDHKFTYGLSNFNEPSNTSLLSAINATAEKLSKIMTQK